MGFGIGLFALAATEPAKAVTMLTKARTPDFADRAVHNSFGFSSHFHKPIILETLAVSQALIFRPCGGSKQTRYSLE